MARQKETKREEKPLPPTPGLAFTIGLILFGMIFCPTGVFLFYNLNMSNRLGILQLSALTLGCMSGLLIAMVPTFIFVQYTMKKIKAKY
jgi:hypothetical protein